MHRALCPVETLYVGQRSRAVLSCTLRGRIDVEALTVAFRAVTQANPTLRSRIVADGAGHALALLDEDERPRLETRAEELAEAYATELNRPLPVGGPLSRAVLVSAPDGIHHLFVLVVDHTVIDGHSSITLHNILWDRYRSLVTDGEARSVQANEPDAPDWPEPVSTLLPPADAADTAAYLDARVTQTKRHPVELVPYDVAHTPDRAPAAGAGEGRIEVCRLTLDTEHTTRLRARARQAGVSVHALIAAALLSTARRRLEGEESRTLGCLSPVDLRSRLTPALPASVMVPAVTTHLQTLEVAAASDPLELARTVHTRLTGFIAGGGHFHEMRITPEIPGNPALQLATVIVTNMGVVPGPRLPGDLRVVDVRLVPAREHYFPQAGRSPVMACVVSFEGRLAIEFPHSTACFSPSFMRAFRDEVLDGLLAFTTAARREPATADAG
ncbi:phthiocerol/phthiodiolone dimycocerosyl transferase family protein [Streptomyces capoamus]|uniref:phthiocerol/phthiodiolone dimycocerosyl transferase family protein n=1 Tax=Streptomyces capoamus TaxID=68183 RepID=UPI0033974BCB